MGSLQRRTQMAQFSKRQSKIFLSYIDSIIDDAPYKRIHVTEVIPPNFAQFEDFDLSKYPTLNYDRSSGWFSRAEIN